MVCLWILACWLSFPLRAVCTSAGMSGDVWLIFIAASWSLTVLRPFAFTSRGYFFSTSPALQSVVSGELDGGTSGKPTRRPFSTWADRDLLLQMGQHSFQKTKRETTKRARPQKPTTTARRLIEMSVCVPQRDTETCKERKKEKRKGGKQVTKCDRQTCKREREKVSCEEKRPALCTCLIKQDSINESHIKPPQHGQNHLFRHCSIEENILSSINIIYHCQSDVREKKTDRNNHFPSVRRINLFSTCCYIQQSGLCRSQMPNRYKSLP